MAELFLGLFLLAEGGTVLLFLLWGLFLLPSLLPPLAGLAPFHLGPLLSLLLLLDVMMDLFSRSGHIPSSRGGLVVMMAMLVF